MLMCMFQLAVCIGTGERESLSVSGNRSRSQGKIGWYDVQLAKIFAPDQQVVSEIAADHGIDCVHEVVGTYIDCCGALDRHRRP